MGGIHERHAHGIEAEDEDVAPQGEAAARVQRQRRKAGDVASAGGALHRLVTAREHAAERVGTAPAAGGGQLVVKGAQRAHVARHGVAAQAAPGEPLLIARRHGGGNV